MTVFEWSFLENKVLRKKLERAVHKMKLNERSSFGMRVEDNNQPSVTARATRNQTVFMVKWQMIFCWCCSSARRQCCIELEKLFRLRELFELKTAYCLGILDFRGKATRPASPYKLPGISLFRKQDFRSRRGNARVPMDALELTVFPLSWLFPGTLRNGKVFCCCGGGSSVELISSSPSMRVKFPRSSSSHHNASGFVNFTSSRAANTHFQLREGSSMEVGKPLSIIK